MTGNSAQWWSVFLTEKRLAMQDRVADQGMELRYKSASASPLPREAARVLLLFETLGLPIGLTAPLVYPRAGTSSVPRSGGGDQCLYLRGLYHVAAPRQSRTSNWNRRQCQQLRFPL